MCGYGCEIKQQYGQRLSSAKGSGHTAALFLAWNALPQKSLPKSALQNVSSLLLLWTLQADLKPVHDALALQKTRGETETQEEDGREASDGASVALLSDQAALSSLLFSTVVSQRSFSGDTCACLEDKMLQQALSPGGRSTCHDAPLLC
jgi:hypothetical protein